jgi:O-succinylbenzoate synthase
MKGAAAMTEPAEDMIVRNLMEALNRLHDDLDRVELWTAALSDFQKPVPEYRSENEYLLPPRKARAAGL